MNVEGVYVDGHFRRRLSAAVYVIISMLGGMAILLFALAMGYQVMQLIYSLL